MHYNDIIIRPILSEKANRLSEEKKQYVFEVSRDSNKIQIKTAIENKFKVKVNKVRTINFLGKKKNTSIRSNGKVLRTSGFRNSWKKAIISLIEGEINIIEGEV